MLKICWIYILYNSLVVVYLIVCTISIVYLCYKLKKNKKPRLLNFACIISTNNVPIFIGINLAQIHVKSVKTIHAHVLK